ncbi:protease modulator HflC [Pragia fontium]|uniref:Protein HflC n=2 Tax=Pragia fontium TaxID=82985 RepID=A0AAJ4W8J4_9GAMM|nr:protease modulator HflC [Pragia fontium]AKJ41029.1 cell division protein FtsH [Pragia fontium]SFC18316.1 membrane protease subunit HflC [Pragia fontium DSM 5563 = ATCC 49100]SUB81218.1 Modulator of FtsH protease HflC [Pragia fontium]VEJ53302.1 Modulator of FtsH protease HflC [Pragia fontium]GKX63194.1 protein HflC [Pragia fontium]
MRKLLIPIIVIVVVGIFTSLFVVEEGSRGIVLRFGKVLRDSQDNPKVYEPGLHFKMPLIDSVKLLDARIQTMNNQADRFVTKETKDLIVDSYVKWKITDFSRYYLATGDGNRANAERILNSKLSDRLRSEIGQRDIKDLVTDSRGQLMQDVRNALNNGYQDKPSETPAVEAANTDTAPAADTLPVDNKLPLVNANSMAELGIQVIDVRIKQINLPTEVSDAIYQRMRAEREAVARRHRSQGQEEAEKIRALADYRVTKTIAEAEREARMTRGTGDATAAKLFADAFSQNPDFYAFIRSLRAYETSFSGGNDVMVLRPDSEFFRYMKSPSVGLKQ